MSTATCGRRSSSTCSPTPSSSPSRAGSRSGCGPGPTGGGARDRAIPASASRRPSCRACSSASTASRASAAAPTRAPASASRWSRSWCGCMAGTIEVRQRRRPRHHLHGHGPARHGTPAGRPDRCCPRPRLDRRQRRRLRRRGPALAVRIGKHRSPAQLPTRGRRCRCRRRRKRILLADDNADMRDYVRRLLAGSASRSNPSPTAGQRSPRRWPARPTSCSRT